MTYRITRAAAAALFFCAAAIPAQAQEPVATRWVADAQGCKHASNAAGGEQTVSWTGACVDGLADGEGTQQWSADGVETNRYVGTLVGGQRHGRGVLRLASGVSLESAFEAGKPVGAAVLVTRTGERRELAASAARQPYGPAAVCSRMGKPRLPDVDGWKGRAAYRAQVVVKKGRVVSAEFNSLESGVPRTVDRALKSAILQALQSSYECPGDHIFEQEFAFKFGN